MSPAGKNKSLLAKKKTHSKKNISRDSEKENNEECGLREFLKKKWKVFRVSPLYNFSSGKLRFYEKKLNEEINSKRRLPVICKSKFTLTKNLGTNENKFAEALQVEVIKDDSERIYSGHFLSLSTPKNIRDTHKFFPILLVEAKENEIHGVHSTLCKIFDCDMQPVTFSFFALITFFVKLLETQRVGCDASQEQVVLEYKVPDCDKKDRIKVALILQDTVVVYAVVKKSLEEKYEDIPAMEVILEFYNKILNHIYKVYQMDMITAELDKIIFPDATLSADGQVKFSNDEAALSTLCVLAKFTPLDAVINM